MVLAHGEHFDILHHHHLVVIFVEDGVIQHFCFGNISKSSYKELKEELFRNQYHGSCQIVQNARM